ESRERGSAVLVFGRRVDHLTHFIIALFTCGIWVPVWIIIAVAGGERRVMVSVDEFGTPIYT
ncbi:MAG: hypothetical protein Q7J82_00295, partial [Coriobacteriia bacterium]|nr:hypothetical protein [Coriobacteriia bacterium]